MRAGKVPNTWLGSLQLTPPLVTCHTPSIVGVWFLPFSPGSLHTANVLAAMARVITAICILSFIFVPLLVCFFFWDDGKLWPQDHVRSSLVKGNVPSII